MPKDINTEKPAAVHRTFSEMREGEFFTKSSMPDLVSTKRALVWMKVRIRTEDDSSEYGALSLDTYCTHPSKCFVQDRPLIMLRKQDGDDGFAIMWETP